MYHAPYKTHSSIMKIGGDQIGTARRCAHHERPQERVKVVFHKDSDKFERGMTAAG